MLVHQKLVEVTLSLEDRCGHTAGTSDVSGGYLILGGQARSPLLVHQTLVEVTLSLEDR